MATLQQIRTKANNVLATFWTNLVDRQVVYHTKHGKYFQLLVTNSVVDGVDTTFEVRKPNDELHPLDVDFTFDSPIPFQISVDEFVAPDSQGFSATATVELLDGRKFSRTREYPSNNDTDWVEVVEIVK